MMVPARVLLLKGYILVAYILYFCIILSKHKLFIHLGFFSFKTDTKYYWRKIVQLLD